MPFFSTCWNSQKHTEGGSLVREILGLGFDTIEVSHGMKLNLLPGIWEAARRGEIRICGVHNFCPSPIEVLIDAPDCYEFTSHRKNDRDRAFALTVKSLETAARFGAGYLVLHLGSVPMKACSARLAKRAVEGGFLDRDYVKAKLAAVKERQALAPLYFERARDVVARLAPEAEKHGVILALESRSHFEQMPSFREMKQLMEEFAGHPWVGYWHDFGHVQLQHNLGFLDHREVVMEMAPHWVGAHVHDVEWPSRDHHVPLLAGGVDFDALLPLVPPGRPLVWELSHRRRSRDIQKGLERWREKALEQPAFA
jgi:sugar phosphate isomerase/epimerase